MLARHTQNTIVGIPRYDIRTRGAVRQVRPLIDMLTDFIDARPRLLYQEEILLILVGLSIHIDTRIARLNDFVVVGEDFAFYFIERELA